MPMVNLEYYKNTFNGFVGPFSDQDLQRNLNDAEDTINTVLSDKFLDGTYVFERFPSYIQDKVKKAICITAEHYTRNGGLYSLESGTSVKQASVGSFSYNADSSAYETSGGDIQLPKRAIELLRATGLLYSGINVC